jgi:lysozyme family protein
MRMPTYRERWPLYAKWWDAAKIRPNQAVEITATVRRLMKTKARYQALEAKTAVPWFLIAALHERESGARFDRQLAQGDALNRRSTNEPISGPFKTFEDSAVWALHHDHLDTAIDWRIEKILYYAELWNGWGYAWYHPSIPSPYVVGGTTVQKSGKYIRDHGWDSGEWDEQIGVMAMLIEFAKQDSSIKFVRETPEGTPGDEAAPKAPPVPQAPAKKPPAPPPKVIVPSPKPAPAAVQPSVKPKSAATTVLQSIANWLSRKP